MPDRSETTTIRTCDWRAGEHCSHRAVERMREAVHEILSGAADAGSAKLLILADGLCHSVKTGAGLARCNLLDGLRCRHALLVPHYEREHRELFVGDVRV